MKRASLLATAIALLVVVPQALAHIEIEPSQAPPDERVTFTVTVPNERSSASTVEVAIRMPDGIGDPQPLDADGWRATVDTDDGKAVLRWVGGEIRKDATASFRFSARLPDSAGERLTFPATQTYSNGEVDHWIEPDDSELPAPVITIVSPTDGAATAGTDDGGSRTVWLIAGTVAVLVAIGAFVVVRRGRSGDGERT